MGLKGYRKLLKHKIVVLPIDYSHQDLNIGPKVMDELLQSLNIIINAGGTSDFNARLDIAKDLNVRAPRMLMELAEKC